MKPITLFIATLVFTSIALGSLFGNPQQDEADNLNEQTGIDTSGVQLGTSWLSEARATESNQQELMKAQPIPNMENSLERQNLINRYKTLNDRDKVFHVYLMSYGKVVAYYTAQGKVSSVNSKLTQPQQLVKCDRADGHGRHEECVVDSPQLDGSYGTNGDGIFFYTTAGEYVEWNGEYLVSETPRNIQTPVSLEAEVNVSQ